MNCLKGINGNESRDEAWNESTYIVIIKYDLMMNSTSCRKSALVLLAVPVAGLENSSRCGTLLRACRVQGAGCCSYCAAQSAIC
jgi:hypothetical protein